MFNGYNQPSYESDQSRVNALKKSGSLPAWPYGEQYYNTDVQQQQQQPNANNWAPKPPYLGMGGRCGCADCQQGSWYHKDQNEVITSPSGQEIMVLGQNNGSCGFQNDSPYGRPESYARIAPSMPKAYQPCFNSSSVNQGYAPKTQAVKIPPNSEYSNFERNSDQYLRMYDPSSYGRKPPEQRQTYWEGAPGSFYQNEMSRMQQYQYQQSCGYPSYNPPYFFQGAPSVQSCQRTPQNGGQPYYNKIQNQQRPVGPQPTPAFLKQDNNAANKISPLRLMRKKKLLGHMGQVSPPRAVNASSENVPALDVRRFLATWADEDEETQPVPQMVVLDCQDINPEQAELLRWYEENAVRAAPEAQSSGPTLLQQQLQKQQHLQQPQQQPQLLHQQLPQHYHQPQPLQHKALPPPNNPHPKPPLQTQYEPRSEVPKISERPLTVEEVKVPEVALKPEPPPPPPLPVPPDPEPVISSPTSSKDAPSDSIVVPKESLVADERETVETSSGSASPSDSSDSLPLLADLPTSEYRKNKFLDYNPPTIPSLPLNSDCTMPVNQTVSVDSSHSPTPVDKTPKKVAKKRPRKPTIKFSIQKSHDLKISFRVLNDSERSLQQEKERMEVTGPGEADSSDLITLSVEGMQESEVVQEEFLEGNSRKSRKLKRRYCQSQSYSVTEGTVSESTADGFQVEESADSAKIKLTFKRRRSEVNYCDVKKQAKDNAYPGKKKRRKKLKSISVSESGYADSCDGNVLSADTTTDYNGQPPKNHTSSQDDSSMSPDRTNSVPQDPLLEQELNVRTCGNDSWLGETANLEESPCSSEKPVKGNEDNLGEASPLKRSPAYDYQDSLKCAELSKCGTNRIESNEDARCSPKITSSGSNSSPLTCTDSIERELQAIWDGNTDDISHSIVKDRNSRENSDEDIPHESTLKSPKDGTPISSPRASDDNNSPSPQPGNCQLSQRCGVINFCRSRSVVESSDPIDEPYDLRCTHQEEAVDRTNISNDENLIADDTLKGSALDKDTCTVEPVFPINDKASNDINTPIVTGTSEDVKDISEINHSGDELIFSQVCDPKIVELINSDTDLEKAVCSKEPLLSSHPEIPREQSQNHDGDFVQGSVKGMEQEKNCSLIGDIDDYLTMDIDIPKTPEDTTEIHCCSTTTAHRIERSVTIEDDYCKDDFLEPPVTPKFVETIDSLVTRVHNDTKSAGSATSHSEVQSDRDFVGHLSSTNEDSLSNAEKSENDDRLEEEKNLDLCYENKPASKSLPSEPSANTGSPEIPSGGHDDAGSPHPVDLPEETNDEGIVITEQELQKSCAFVEPKDHNSGLDGRNEIAAVASSLKSPENSISSLHPELLNEDESRCQAIESHPECSVAHRNSNNENSSLLVSEDQIENRNGLLGSRSQEVLISEDSSHTIHERDLAPEISDDGLSSEAASNDSACEKSSVVPATVSTQEVLSPHVEVSVPRGPRTPDGSPFPDSPYSFRSPLSYPNESGSEGEESVELAFYSNVNEESHLGEAPTRQLTPSHVHSPLGDASPWKTEEAVNVPLANNSSSTRSFIANGIENTVEDAASTNGRIEEVDGEEGDVSSPKTPGETPHSVSSLTHEDININGNALHESVELEADENANIIVSAPASSREHASGVDDEDASLEGVPGDSVETEHPVEAEKSVSIEEKTKSNEVDVEDVDNGAEDLSYEKETTECQIENQGEAESSDTLLATSKNGAEIAGDVETRNLILEPSANEDVIVEGWNEMDELEEGEIVDDDSDEYILVTDCSEFGATEMILVESSDGEDEVMAIETDQIIAVADIPLPPGDAPKENCFDLKTWKRGPLAHLKMLTNCERPISSDSPFSVGNIDSFRNPSPPHSDYGPPGTPGTALTPTHEDVNDNVRNDIVLSELPEILNETCGTGPQGLGDVLESTVASVDGDQVPNDAEFQDVMANCLENAKRFLDGEPFSADEHEKPKDVLLTSFGVQSDTEISGEASSSHTSPGCPPSSVVWAPDILPVDNWPYLEEEVPLSPSRISNDDSISDDLLNTPEMSSENVDSLEHPLLPRFLCTDRSREALRDMLHVGRDDSEAIVGADSLSKRRRTVDGVSSNCSKKRFKKLSLTDHESSSEATVKTSQRHVKCRLSLERLNLVTDGFVGRQSSTDSSIDATLTGDNELPTTAVKVLGSKLGGEYYKASRWQPKVLLNRISPVDLTENSSKSSSEKSCDSESVPPEKPCSPNKSVEFKKLSVYSSETFTDVPTNKISNEGGTIRRRKSHTSFVSESRKSGKTSAKNSIRNKCSKYKSKGCDSAEKFSEGGGIHDTCNILSTSLQRSGGSRRETKDESQCVLNAITDIGKSTEVVKGYKARDEVLQKKTYHNRNVTEATDENVNDKLGDDHEKEDPRKHVEKCPSKEDVNSDPTESLSSRRKRSNPKKCNMKKGELVKITIGNDTRSEDMGLNGKHVSKSSNVCVVSRKNVTTQPCVLGEEGQKIKRHLKECTKKYDKAVNLGVKKSVRRDDNSIDKFQSSETNCVKDSSGCIVEDLRNGSDQEGTLSSAVDDTLPNLWACEVCGFSEESLRETHIQEHSFHCQSCHLAFKSEALFIEHLNIRHQDVQKQHHCLLCECSFSFETEYQDHLKSREHVHLEAVEKSTIQTLFKLLTGHGCPVLGNELPRQEWMPSQAGTVHFYHQATPLSLAIQYWKLKNEKSPAKPSTSLSFKKS